MNIKIFVISVLFFFLTIFYIVKCYITLTPCRLEVWKFAALLIWFEYDSPVSDLNAKRFSMHLHCVASLSSILLHCAQDYFFISKYRQSDKSELLFNVEGHSGVTYHSLQHRSCIFSIPLTVAPSVNRVITKTKQVHSAVQVTGTSQNEKFQIAALGNDTYWMWNKYHKYNCQHSRQQDSPSKYWM